jgi:CRP/FNR family transcriptional regulator, cyclic AMP receptor protein
LDTSSFHNLSTLEISKIKAHSVRREYASDQLIFSEGDDVDSFYIIEKGYVSIFIDHNGQLETISVLEPGDYFGEMAIMNNETRFASAMSLGETVLLAIEKDTFLDFVKTHPIMSEKIKNILMKRHRTLWDKKNRI